MFMEIHFATLIISLDPPDTLGRTAPEPSRKRSHCDVRESRFFADVSFIVLSTDRSAADQSVEPIAGVESP